MSKFIKVKMLKNDSLAKKGEKIVVEERYAELYLFPKKKAKLIEEVRKSKEALPIPKHLIKILIPKGNLNSELLVHGIIMYECGCKKFLVSVYGNKEGKDIYVGEYEEESALVVNAECMECKKKHLIFDMSKHGWNGFVCNDGITVPHEELFTWTCNKCGSNFHYITVSITSEGKEDYIENLFGDVGDGQAFREDDWVEAFGWITIDLKCFDCGFTHKRMVDYETM